MLLNLFLAILLKFITESDEKEQDNKVENSEPLKSIVDPKNSASSASVK